MAALALLAITACGGGELVANDLPSCKQFRDGHWDQRLVTPGASGVDPKVTELQRMPDGSVIAGGSFDAMSGTTTRNVARWDGTRWSPLGEGLPGQVISLAVDDRGQLWAVGDNLGGKRPDPIGGEEDAIGFGTYLARWTGAEWIYVVKDQYSITGVAAVDGGIAIYGSFFEQASLPASGVAIWRDGVWSSTGLFPGSNYIRSAARAPDGLCVSGQLESPAGFLYGAACWNGSTWARLGTAFSSEAEAIVRGGDGRWYVGGSFNLPQEGNDRYGIARLEDDGEWRVLDGGVHGRPASVGVDVPWEPYVTSISVEGDELVIAGRFEWVGVPKRRAYHLARWSPRDGWSAMTTPADLFGQLSAVLATGDVTYVGGSFRRIGIEAGSAIASVSTGTVRSLPAATLAPTRLGAISDMIALPDGLVVAGRFQENQSTEGLLRFDGAWKTIEGVPADASMTAVSLGNEGYAVRSNTTLYRRLTGERWKIVTDKPVTGPLVADGDGTLFFVIATDPYATIVQSTREDTSFYSLVPGNVVAMTIYEGELVVVTTNPMLGGETIYRRRNDDWELIGAWSDYTSSLVVSPALGLVAGTQQGTRVWDGSQWRIVSSAQVYDLAACADGVVAAIDEGDGSRLGFLDDLDGAWTYFGEPRGAQWWQITPTERGIYLGTAFAGKGGITADSPLGFSRWTLDDSGW